MVARSLYLHIMHTQISYYCPEAGFMPVATRSKDEYIHLSSAAPRRSATQLQDSPHGSRLSAPQVLVARITPLTCKPHFLLTAAEGVADIIVCVGEAGMRDLADTIVIYRLVATQRLSEHHDT